MRKKVKYMPDNWDLPIFRHYGKGEDNVPTKEGQIDTIMTDLIDDAHDNYRRVIRGALLRAYNRGFEAGAMKAQEQMMEDERE